MFLKRLALTLVLGATLVASALAQPFKITVEHDLDPTYDVPFAVMFQENLDQMGGGASWPYSFSGTGSFDNAFEQGVETGILSMIGLYTGVANMDTEIGSPGLVMMMRNAYALEIIGLPFENLFSSHTEAELIAALQGVQAGGEGYEANLDLVGDFFNQNKQYWASAGETASFIGFSDAKNFGSGSWQQQPVPEPGLMLAGGAALAFFVRRKKAA